MDGRCEPVKPPGGDERQPSSAQVPEAASGVSRPMLLLGIVFLCVVAAGVSAATLSLRGGSQTSHIAGTGSSPAGARTRAARPTRTTTGTAQPTAPRARSHALTGADVTSNGVAKSALQWPPQLERQMLRWWAGRGGAALTTVETQMGNAMQAAGLKLYVPMRLACVNLASGIGTAQADPPIPYDAMQRPYAKVLAGLSRAATDCRTAISEHPGDETLDVHLNQGLLNLSRAEFAAMSSKLYRATAEILALGR